MQWQTFSSLIQQHTLAYSADNDWFENFQECPCGRVPFSKVANSRKALLLKSTP